MTEIDLIGQQCDKGAHCTGQKQLTLNFAGEDTVTSATSQADEGAPDRCQSASRSCPLHSTWMARLSDSAGNQYLNMFRRTLKSSSDNSLGMFVLADWTHQKRTHISVVEVRLGVSS